MSCMREERLLDDGRMKYNLIVPVAGLYLYGTLA